MHRTLGTIIFLAKMHLYISILCFLGEYTHLMTFLYYTVLLTYIKGGVKCVLRCSGRPEAGIRKFTAGITGSVSHLHRY